MSIEQNKMTVLAFLESLARGEPDEALLCDDARWWIPGTGVIDREAFLALSARVHQRFSGPGRFETTAITAEDDRVAVETSGRFVLQDGRRYENTYHFLFRLHDGRIRESREHNNTAIPAALFRPD
jgi:ketosteroid isomerase-like protein